MKATGVMQRDMPMINTGLKGDKHGGIQELKKLGVSVTQLRSFDTN